VFIIYLVKFSFLFFFYLFGTDCVFSVNKDYQLKRKYKYDWLRGVRRPRIIAMNSQLPRSVVNELMSDIISQPSSDVRQTEFLFPRLSVIMQRSNAVLFSATAACL